MDRVNEVTAQCFNALIQIHNLEDDGQLAPEMFHARLISFIDGVFFKGRQAGLQEHDVQDMAYALVALADELALRRPGAIRNMWMSNPLQLHYFNENVAGEGFFQRLQHLIRDPSRIDVLRVYYQCLLLGFLGKYAVRGGELELTAVTRRAQDALSRQLVPEPLSRHHLRPKERIKRQRQGYLTLWIGLFAILFALALLIALRVTLDNQTESQADRIEAMVAC
jgi:type VI secretion system protein ImpK